MTYKVYRKWGFLYDSCLTGKFIGGSGASGYEIRYKTGSTVKKVKMSGVSTLKKTISGLAKNKTYTVSVRSYKTSGGTTWYSSWSGTKKVKVSK